MLKAQLITIGTEITSGEVVNSNAAWVATRLEERGVRVFSHLSVCDHRDEILKALRASGEYGIVVVTGGLGPTTDDITRECLAEYASVALEFDGQVHNALIQLYEKRGHTLREAHKQQCFFPKGAIRLENPVGTALGFQQEINGRHFFVLPGPPGELEGIWNLEVDPRLTKILPAQSFRWRRWTCMGSPESEVAELVEKVIAGQGLEVGYRAAVPYVKVKLYLDLGLKAHQLIAGEIEKVLAPFIVGREMEDLADELLSLWPLPELEVWDMVTGDHLAQRLFSAQRKLYRKKSKAPHLSVHSIEAMGAVPADGAGIQVRQLGEEFIITMSAGGKIVNERKTLPYSGKRSVTEFVLWSCVKQLRAR